MVETLVAQYSAILWLERPFYAQCEPRRNKTDGDSANNG